MPQHDPETAASAARRATADPAIPEVPVELRPRHGQPVTRATGPDGAVDFHADVGPEQVVRVLPPDGYTFPAGETGSRRVRLEIGRDTVVRVMLTPPGG